MRYQRISPDSLPLSNGRRTNSTSNPNWKTSKEDEDRGEINGSLTGKSSSTFEGKAVSRFRSPSRSSQEHHIVNGNSNGTISTEVPNSPPTTTTATRNHHQNLESYGVVGGGGDTFLQWGHRKRSRCSRGIGMALTDDTSSSTSTLQFQPSTKLQRRSSVPNSSSSSPNANLMPPPPSLTATNGIARGPIIRPQNKNLSSTPSPVRRNLEERSGGGFTKSPPPGGNSGGGSSRAVSSRSRIGKKTAPSVDKKNPSLVSTRDEKINGCSLQKRKSQEAVNSDVMMNTANNNNNSIVSPPQQGGCSSMNDDNNNHNNEGNAGRPGKLVGTAGGGFEVNEWPRICIPLSRKEKEEDFLVMKGTKLPHRPKKRPKAVERTLQYCFPGLWLSDLPRGRYEVREKKCPRKPKRRGLKGMESMESDSE